MIFSGSAKALVQISVRGIRRWPESSFSVEAFIPTNAEDRSLPILDSAPQVWPEGAKNLPVKDKRAVKDMRGPERIHNQLRYGQYGIIALGGGSLRPGHISMIRDVVNRHLDTERMFAVWRIDPPWKAVSKKTFGKRMGSGKSKVHHFETPVKAGRIIVEVGGRLEYDEIRPTLHNVCQLLPFDAMAISQQLMDDLAAEKQKLDSMNINPFTMSEAIDKNLNNCRFWLSTYDIETKCKYP